MNVRARRRAAPVGSATQVLVAGLLGAALGLTVLWGRPSWALGLAAAVGLAMVALIRADLVLLALLVATSTIVPEGLLPSVTTPLGRFYAPDVVLLALFAALTARWLFQGDWTMAPTPLDAPLLAFFAVALLGMLAAVSRGAITLTAGLRETRIVSYYLTFFLVTHLVRRGPRLKSVLRGMMVAATLVAAAMLAQYAVGSSVRLLPGRVETLYTEGAQHIGVTRILPPGQALVLAGLILQTVTLVLGRFSVRRLAGYALWGLLGMAVLLTFNRSFWVAAFIALALLVMLLAGEGRRRLIAWGVVSLVLVVALVVALSSGPASRAERLATASLERLGSLVRAETFVSPESSLGWRGVEYAHALPQLTTRPILGLGLGSAYRPWDERLDSATFDGRAYIHNGHLWIALKTGWLGCGCLLWFSALFLSRSLRRWRGVADPTLRAVVLGSGTLYAGVLVASLVNPILMQWSWTPVLGVLIGCSEAAIGTHGPGERTLGRG